MGRCLGQGCLSDLFFLGQDKREFDLNKLFPPIPPGNIYIAFTGGVESTLVLYLLLERYPNRNIIPCTWKFGDRRLNEYEHALSMCAHLGVLDKHVLAGYTKDSTKIVNHPKEPIPYFNKENLVFELMRKQDPDFVVGFTGKNTTLLDPEKITPEEQEKYLVWYDVHRPLLFLDKHHVVDLYYQLGVEDLLLFAHTCYVAIEQPNYDRGIIPTKDTHCGLCAACIERLEAFDRNGIKDPAIYDGDYEVLIKRARSIYDRAGNPTPRLL
jgi:7-cyano-7-deazaguanine synthase